MPFEWKPNQRERHGHAPLPTLRSPHPYPPLDASYFDWSFTTTVTLAQPRLRLYLLLGNGENWKSFLHLCTHSAGYVVRDKVKRWVSHLGLSIPARERVLQLVPVPSASLGRNASAQDQFSNAVESVVAVLLQTPEKGQEWSPFRMGERWSIAASRGVPEDDKGAAVIPRLQIKWTLLEADPGPRPGLWDVGRTEVVFEISVKSSDQELLGHFRDAFNAEDFHASVSRLEELADQEIIRQFRADLGSPFHPWSWYIENLEPWRLARKASERTGRLYLGHNDHRVLCLKLGHSGPYPRRQGRPRLSPILKDS